MTAMMTDKDADWCSLFMFCVISNWQSSHVSNMIAIYKYHRSLKLDSPRNTMSPRRRMGEDNLYMELLIGQLHR